MTAAVKTQSPAWASTAQALDYSTLYLTASGHCVKARVRTDYTPALREIGATRETHEYTPYNKSHTRC